MTTSLVTGGAGFIGSHIAEHLQKMGHEVVILDDLSGGDINNVPQNACFIKGSILDVPLLERIFKDYKPDYVFHLAAYAAEALSAHIRRYNYETNVIGSVNLINAAVNYGVKRFVFTSSAAVYGRGNPSQFLSEDDRPAPIDPYGIAKWTVEQDLAAAYGLFGLPHTIFRCHNVFGERQNLNDPYRNVVGIFMRACLNGEPMPIYGDGSQTRPFTYIGNIAPHIAQCVDNPAASQQIINIGTDFSRSIRLLADDISHTMGGSAGILHLPERQEARHIVLDHSKAERLFGVQKNTTVFEGLRRMATWAKTQKLEAPKPFAAIEIEKGLSEHWRKLNVHRESN